MADDDSWLYGEDNEEEQEESRETQEVQEADVVKGETLLIGLYIVYLQFYMYITFTNYLHLPFLLELSQVNDMAPVEEDDGGGSGSDDDSDDDGIKVTIDKDKIEAAKSSYQNMQVLFKVLLISELVDNLWYFS